jgi:CheY-like chemotaxis protein
VLFKPSPEQPIERYRILVIDDRKEDAEVLGWTLGKVPGQPYTVTWVDNAADGLAAIADRAHDAYLVDQRLSGALGTDLVREARAGGCRDPMIMFTASRERSVDADALEAGADDFLVKGEADVAHLDRTLRYAIRQARVTKALHRDQEEVWALERIGVLLSREGPTPESLSNALSMIGEAFGYPQMSVYIPDGSVLRLAAQRGYGDAAMATIDRSSALIDRVVRAASPRFVASLTPSPDARNSDLPRSELCLPLVVDAEVLGLLLVGSPDQTPLGEVEYAILRAIAERLALALELDRERMELSAAVRRMRQLGEFARIANRRLQEAGATVALLEAIAEIVPADRLVIARLDGDGFREVAAVGTGGDKEPGALGRRAIEEGRLVVDPAIGPDGTLAVAVPLGHDGGKLGVLQLWRSLALSRPEREMLALLGEQLAMALALIADREEPATTIESSLEDVVAHRVAQTGAATDPHLGVVLVDVSGEAAMRDLADAASAASANGGIVARLRTGGWGVVVSGRERVLVIEALSGVVARLEALPSGGAVHAAGGHVTVADGADPDEIVAAASAAMELSRRSGGTLVVA